MRRFRTKNLSESDIQKLNEQDTGKYEQQSLLAITADEIQPGINILNKALQQAANQLAAEGKKVKYYPVKLGREEKSLSGTDFIGPTSFWYISVNGKRIPATSNEFSDYDSPVQTSDFNDQYQGGDNIGLINGSHKLGKYFSKQNTNRLDSYKNAKIRQLVKLLKAPTSMLTPGFVDQNGKVQRFDFAQLKNQIFAKGGPIEKAISGAINKKFNKFVALNKQEIAKTNTGQVNYGQTSQGPE